MKTEVLTTEITRPELIPVLTLHRPWALWVMAGWKTIETRLHAKFTCLRGRTIAIHAAQYWDKDALHISPFLTDQQRTQTYAWKGNATGSGKLVCTVRVHDARWIGAFDTGMSEEAMICCDTRRFGLFLDELKLTKQIPIKGMQGIQYINAALLQ